MNKLLSMLVAWALATPVLAGQAVPPFTEAVLPIGPDVYAAAIGPGGPGDEFGSDATNGGLYRIAPDGMSVAIELSDGQGLRNPTGLVEIGGNIVLVDGNQIISATTGGQVNWRRALEIDGVFFYDIEVLNADTLIVSDFGRGVFVTVDAHTGEIKRYLDHIQISGLARFEVSDAGIYAVSWGADDAWDSALYLVSIVEETARLEMIVDGFGNLESVETLDGNIIVGGYRGHEDYPDAKLLQVAPDRVIKPLTAGSRTQGISDLYVDGTTVWLTYFYDASYEALPTEMLLSSN